MNTIRNFARLFVAPFFVFSGFVKAIDPIGSAIKFQEYFEAFGMDFLHPLAMPLAILMNTAELLIGLALIMGILMRITSWGLMILMTFFTILTLYLAITNPVTDCGCFGDAIKLTPWQTFWKNIILMIPTLIVFFNRRMFKSFTYKGAEWGIAILFIVIGILLSVTALRNLPFIDFRPYKIGTNIASAMKIPEGEELDEYETVFIYEKDGVEKEFQVEELTELLQDSTWKYVDRKTNLIKKGYEPPIHDFSVTTLEGEDITDSVLNSSNYALLVIAYDLSKSNEKGLRKVEKFSKTASESGINVFGLTASVIEDITTIQNEYNMPFNFYTTDDVALKTMVRANPGVIMLKEGTIIGKWHYKNLPELKNFNGNMLSTALSNNNTVKKGWVIAFFISLFFTTIFFLVILVRRN